MPFQIIHRDLTLMDCDAIVNPTDEWLSGSGGTDLAVHRAAGSELDAVCRGLEGLRTGTVAVTDGYRLPSRYVFHTVGPVWQGGKQNEEALLRSCYLNALLMAGRMELSSVAFPLISSGTFGFPKDRVLRIAADAVSDYLLTADSELQVYLCILDRDAFVLSSDAGLREFVGSGKKNPVFENSRRKYGQVRNDSVVSCGAVPAEAMPSLAFSETEELVLQADAAPPMDLADWLKKQDDSFAVTLLKLIDRKEMTDVQCYKKANVSKGTFWKINNDPKYRPSRETVLAFAIALELTLEETRQLLKTVGFALSDSFVFDRIITYYIMNGNYDIFEINAALFRYDQPCLGC